MQVQNEALSLNESARKNLISRPLSILQEVTDPIVAVQAALVLRYLRYEKPDVDVLIAAFREAPGELATGHLALLLAETGDEQAVEVLKPHLNDESRHVRYRAALALDILGFDELNVLDELLMVKVPAGEFTFGGRGLAAPTPHRMAAEPFMIDRFPLTNAHYRRFVDAGGYLERRHWSDAGWQWKEKMEGAIPALLDHPEYGVLSAPVVAISKYEAEAYGNWVGKRLPTEQEWERAARGDQDTREYPWGDEFTPSKANTREAGINQPTPVGSFPGGVSPYGCFDMAGNVLEWTSSSHEQMKGERYVVRGGSWPYNRGLARWSVRFRGHPDDRGSDMGVRFSRTL